MQTLKLNPHGLRFALRTLWLLTIVPVAANCGAPAATDSGAEAEVPTAPAGSSSRSPSGTTSAATPLAPTPPRPEQAAAPTPVPAQQPGADQGTPPDATPSVPGPVASPTQNLPAPTHRLVYTPPATTGEAAANACAGTNCRAQGQDQTLLEPELIFAQGEDDLESSPGKVYGIVLPGWRANGVRHDVVERVATAHGAQGSNQAEQLPGSYARPAAPMEGGSDATYGGPGFSFQGFLGGGGGYEAVYVWDDAGHRGIAQSVNGGYGTPGAQAGVVVYQFTTAPSIYDLRGTSTVSAVSIGPVSLSFIEGNYAGGTKPYWGMEITVGPPAGWPLGVSSTQSTTTLFDPMDVVSPMFNGFYEMSNPFGF